MTVSGSTNVSIKNESSPASGRATGKIAPWRPFESLRQEIDRLFEDFGRDWRSPFRRGSFDPESFLPQALNISSVPAVDISDKENAYEITAELPGMDRDKVEVKVANGALFIRGEKLDEKEEKKKDYYLKERKFGSFERSFRIPEDVDADKIEAHFEKGVLSVTLPKRPADKKPEKQIEIKSA